MTPKTRLTKSIAPKVNQDAAAWIGETFPNLNAGATFILESFPHLYQQTLSEIRGKFSGGELTMILDVLNGHGTILCSGSPSMAGQHLALSISDSFRLYPGQHEQRHGIGDKQAFIDRIATLPRFAQVCLEVWAAGFWKVSKTISAEEWIEQLTGRD